ncbi:LIN1-like protein [Leucoagaricus sp. SymC.cos]|nr:LIN1-like protein [Leucoagaricus sp. SymC.cos]
MSRPQGKKRSATTADSSRDSSLPDTPSLPQHASKKTRFADPDEDPTNFAEQVDSALEGPTRKRAVKTEGYESDSSDDGEGVVYSRRKGEDGAGDYDLGGEDDMFAAAEKATPSSRAGGADLDGKKKKKEEKYMRLGDIEGQEFDGNASGDEDEDSEEESEGEPEDEDDAERRKKVGMGYELSSFNMREEMEEGKFTADGMYVRTFDPHGQHDRWMDGLSEKEIKTARKRKKQQEKIQKQKQVEEDRELRESGGKEAMEKQLLPHLKKGETVLEALQRLGAQSKKKQAKNKKNTKHAPDAMSVDASSATKLPPTDIELITHLASNLMSLGDTDIYSKTYEELVRDVRRSGMVDQNWEPPSADVKFEYKWDVPGADDSHTFGPFSEEEMQAWFKALYFGPGGEKVKVRTVGGEWAGWDDLLD